MPGANGNVGNGTRVLGGVEETEVIGTCSTFLQIDGYDWRGKRSLDVVEERLLCSGPDCVDGAESEAEQTVGINVLSELRADGGCSLNGLSGDSSASNLAKLIFWYN